MPARRIDAGHGPQQAADGAHDGRLAGAVGAEQRHQLALAHLEGDALQHRDRAVAGGERRRLPARPAGRPGAGWRAGARASRRCRGRPPSPWHRCGWPRARRRRWAGRRRARRCGRRCPSRGAMSCSTRMTARPASASLRSTALERGLVGAHQAGGRLVEQQHRGARGERAGDLDQAAVDVRQGRPRARRARPRSRRTRAGPRQARGRSVAAARPADCRAGRGAGRSARCRAR